MSTPVELTRTQLIRSLTTAVYDQLLNRDDPEIVEQYEGSIRRSLQGYDEGFLREALAIVGTAMVYNERSHNTAAMLDNNEPESVIRAYWHFAPFLVEDINSPFPPQLLLESLRHYPELQGYLEGTRYTEEKATRQCAAVVNVVLTLCNEPIHHGKESLDHTGQYNLPALKDKRLVTLLVEHPDYSERVIDIINKRGKADYGLIMVALELDDRSVALSSGIL